MSECPHMAKLRPELPALTPRIAALPVDERGYPVPFFVAWVDGKPEFRMSDPAKYKRCALERLCWVCGQPLGVHMAFTIGPMCAVNRTTAEPPEHLDCALWSVKGCPFLARPNMVRREDELTRSNEGNVAGEMIKRNPGAVCIWVTKSYQWFKDGRGGYLIRIGEPTVVSWWREARPAMREEVLESIDSGMPLLREKCREADELAALEQARLELVRWLPPRAEGVSV